MEVDDGFSEDMRQEVDAEQPDDGDAVGEDAAGRWPWRVWGAERPEEDERHAARPREGEVE